MTADLQDRRVLITAGASGIGRAIAERFLAAGARVFVCDIAEEALADIKAKQPSIGAVRADVGDAAQVAVLFARVDSAVGGLDVLVNNAGVGGPRAALDAIEISEWEATIRVNLGGTFYCTQQAARLMKPQRSGCIVNISTASVRTGLPLRAPYVASKAGVQGLTRNTARELGPYNIRCNAVLPGAIDNPRGHALVERKARELGVSIAEAEAQKLNYVSMRSRVTPEEVGDVCVFLASDGGRHVSGQMIGVCGNSEWEI
jgi:NAD(P)-dependent dehydrogenase (short-subunit alcohol dehydrogenase family)